MFIKFFPQNSTKQDSDWEEGTSSFVEDVRGKNAIQMKTRVIDATAARGQISRRKPDSTAQPSKTLASNIANIYTTYNRTDYERVGQSIVSNSERLRRERKVRNQSEFEHSLKKASDYLE